MSGSWFVSCCLSGLLSFIVKRTFPATAINSIGSHSVGLEHQENFNEVYIVGDCLEPRKIYHAIHEAAFIGRTI